MADTFSSDRRHGAAVQKLVTALVTTAVGTRGLFAVACGLYPRKLMTELFGSRFDGPGATILGLLFAGTDAALGSGLHRSRKSPRRLVGWLWAGVGIDLVHTVLASTNRDVSLGRRRATAAFIGSLAVTGAVLALIIRAPSVRFGPRVCPPCDHSPEGVTWQSYRAGAQRAAAGSANSR